MTTAELMEALAQECPNGVSFDLLALRLLRQKVPFDDWQIEVLKGAMFHLGNGLWFSRQMVLDEESRVIFEGQVMEWLTDHGCFSVERLFENYCGVLRHIATPEACSVFLRYLGFTVADWGKGGYLCSLPPPNLNDSLSVISETIADWLEEADGTLTFQEIEQTMPNLTAEALDCVRAQFLPEVHAAEISGMPCWCTTEAIHLPENFSEELTRVVDTLVALEKRVSATNLEFAFNLLYRVRFREEYALKDNDTFMRVCAKHYQGDNDVFPNAKKPQSKPKGHSVPGRRVRSPNTRFDSLGVPVGARLVFTKDSHITCNVLDESNQVEYDGKTWAISALANHLLGVSAANGFVHFSYEGETLWERRLRLKSDHNQNEYQGEAVPAPIEVQEGRGEIIGLEGRPLSPSTWRALRRDGTNPRVAEWARRVEKGERVEQIARESGYAKSTMKIMISNHRLYFRVCQRNGIVAEGSSNV